MTHGRDICERRAFQPSNKLLNYPLVQNPLTVFFSFFHVILIFDIASVDIDFLNGRVTIESSKLALFLTPNGKLNLQ